MDEVIKIAIPALVGLFAGALGSLVAPWVTWGIEKRKLLLVARRDFIAAVRKELGTNADKESFRDSAIYSQLRPHLSECTRKDIESDAITIQMGGRGSGTNNFSPRVYDDLHALEKKWGLI